MAKPGITVTGLEEVYKKLNNLPAKLRNKVLRQATKDAAKVVADTVRSLAPEATGELEHSIKVRAAKRSRTSVGYQILSTDLKAVHVEFGTSDTKEQSFLRKGLHEKHQEAVNIIRDAIAARLPQ